jgi:hypothetical protein
MPRLPHAIRERVGWAAHLSGLQIHCCLAWRRTELIMQGRPRQRFATPGARAQNRGLRTSGASDNVNHKRYLALAREASARGDTIEAENFYQHAEHYLRQMREKIG